MEVDNIEDLKFKLGESFKSYHISIKNDNMYISEEFAKYLTQNYRDKTSGDYRTPHRINYNHNRITIGVGGRLRGDGYVYRIYGHCGDWSFNMFPIGFKLGVRTKRAVNKYLVGVYLDSMFPRMEKLKRIKLKIDSKK